MITIKVCPKCRNYNLERSWCELCGKSGLIKVDPVKEEETLKQVRNQLEEMVERFRQKNKELPWRNTGK